MGETTQDQAAVMATIHVPAPIPKPPRRVTLEMTEAHARALVIVLSRTGGHPERSPRALIDDLYRALEAVKIHAPYENDGAAGSVAFEEGPLRG